jgi:two-component system, NtrC family, nitrogen regulation response regulator GlnG
MRKPVTADISTFTGPKRGSGEPSPRLQPTLTVLSHPLAHRVAERHVLAGLDTGREVALSRNAPDFVKLGSALGAPLGDPFLSRKPIRFVPGLKGQIAIHVDEGGTPVIAAGEPVHRSLTLEPEALIGGVPIELGDRVALLLHLTSSDTSAPSDLLGMVGQSEGVARVREHIERIGDLSIPVLIRGETGTGKELVARAIHERSPRKSGPFVSVNLGAIPRELAAAELFGAQKGAYTGATRDREGFFRAARGGTLFLDEMGEAPPEVQVMLLRVLETGEMYPVGGHAPIATDVRLLAATDANLEEQIREGRFKAPLLHRLAGYEIRLPPLRERREDFGVLFYHFAREELAAIGEAHHLDPVDPRAAPWLPASLAARLVCQAWPGNIRQLRNVTRQLVVGSRGKPQVQSDSRLLGEQEYGGSSAVSTVPEIGGPGKAPWRKGSEVSEEELLEALKACAWDLKSTADRLGIARSSIYDRIDRSPSIRTAGDLSAAEIEECFRACQGDVDAMVQKLSVSRRALSRRIKELGLGSKGA